MQSWKQKFYGATGFLATTAVVGEVFGRQLGLSLLWAGLAVLAIVAGVVAFRHWEKHSIDGQLHRYIRLQTAQMRKLTGFSQASQSIYLVLGPSFAGKSRLLEQAGLVRVADIAPDDAPDITPPTFWLGAQGLFIELPGALVESQALRVFVTTLRRLRARRAYQNLAGVMLCLEAGVLQHAQPHVESLRAPLEHIAKCFGRRPPTYLMLTQTDHIAGFKQCFGHLSEREKDHSWGLALSATAIMQTEMQVGFGRMLTALRKYATLQLGRILSLEERIEGYRFAEKIAALAPGLAHTLDAVFIWHDNIYAPILRGIYFCAADVGPPHPAQPAMGLTAPAWQQPLTPNSYFGASIVHTVMPQFGKCTRLVAYPGVRGLWQRCSIPLTLTGMMALTMPWQATAMLANRGLVSAAERAALVAIEPKISADEEQTEAERAEHWLASLEALGPMRRQLARLESYETRGVPWYLGCGLFQGRYLLVPMNQIFMARLKLGVLEPLHRRGIQSLQIQEVRHASPQAVSLISTSAQLAQHLKAHLLLTTPKDPSELAADTPKLGWLQLHLRKQLNELYKLELDDTDGESFNDALRRYLLLVAHDPQLAWRRDAQRVSSARAVLGRLPAADVLIAMLEVDAREHYSLGDVGLATFLGSIASPMRTPYKIEGIYTREGYDLFGQPFLEAQKTGGDMWVLAAKPLRSETLRRHAQQVKQRYYERYIDTWQHMIDSVRFVAPRDITQALGAVVDLTRSEPPPLIRLFAAIAYHTRLSVEGIDHETPLRSVTALQTFGHRVRQAVRALTDPSADAAEPVRQHVGGAQNHPVEQAFAPLVRFGAPLQVGQHPQSPLYKYQDRLIAIRQALQGCVADSRESDRVLSLVQKVQQETLDVMAQEDSGLGIKTRLETLLIQPLRGVTKSLARGARAYQGDSYCASVVEPFAALRHSYPFDPAGLDAPLADVLSFFRPETGHLWRYYNKELGQDILAVGERFAFDSRLEGAMRLAYAPEILDYLTQAQSVTQALFSDGQEGMTFEVRLRPDPAIDLASLDISGVTVPYKTLEWTSIQWPGPKPSQGAQLVVTMQNGTREIIKYDGAWGLFRLLEAGRVRGEADAGAVRIDWPLAAQRAAASLEIRVVRRQNLLLGPMRRAPMWAALRDARLVPPSRIAQGVAPCRLSRY